MNLSKHGVLITFLLCSIALIWVSINISFGKEDWRGVLESDAKGYYAYLPAVFIYQDLNFSFFEEIEKKKYYQEHLFTEYRNVTANGQKVNKYYCGTAVAQVPFFLTAHGISYLSDQELDGYSKWYMLFVCISAIFYHLFGLWFLIKLLYLYKVSKPVIALLSLACSFGTHLFVYTIVEPGMSHVYSFAFIALFLYVSKRYFVTGKVAPYLPLMALSLGMIVICRPINVLVVFALPFLSGSIPILYNRVGGLFKSVSYLIISFLLFASIVSLQPIIYKISAGTFWVYSYGQETFNFLNPNIIDMLFSYKKGLFLYTPILFLGFLSALTMIKVNRFQSISWLLFFTLITYIFSSWWMWFYGGSFSSRVYVEYIPLFILPLALLMSRLKNFKRKLLMYVVGILIMVCQIQSYQYRYYEIHYSEMTKEKYWDVFLMRNRF